MIIKHTICNITAVYTVYSNFSFLCPENTLVWLFLRSHLIFLNDYFYCIVKDNKYEVIICKYILCIVKPKIGPQGTNCLRPRCLATQQKLWFMLLIASVTNFHDKGGHKDVKARRRIAEEMKRPCSSHIIFPFCVHQIQHWHTLMLKSQVNEGKCFTNSMYILIHMMLIQSSRFHHVILLWKIAIKFGEIKKREARQTCRLLCISRLD